MKEDEVRKMYITFPPMEEQIFISEHLSRYSLKITTAIACKQAEIEKLNLVSNSNLCLKTERLLNYCNDKVNSDLRQKLSFTESELDAAQIENITLREENESISKVCN
jgi:hypothetical protein